MRIQADRDTGRMALTAKASQLATVLEHILRHRTPTRIAREQNLPETTVLAIRDAHGFPHASRLRDAHTHLTRLGDQEVTFDVPDPTHHRPEQDTHVTTTPAPTQPTQPAPSTPAPPTTSPAGVKSLDDLIADNLNHEVARIRNRAEKIAALAVRLRADIAADVADAARRERIRKLKAELAQLTAHTKPAPSDEPAPERTCTTCDRVFVSKQGLVLHNTRIHSGQDKQVTA